MIETTAFKVFNTKLATFLLLKGFGLLSVEGNIFTFEKTKNLGAALQQYQEIKNFMQMVWRCWRMSTREKCKLILTKLPITVTGFCRKIGISTTAFYRWLAGDLKLSEQTEQRIRDYFLEMKEVLQ